MAEGLIEGERKEVKKKEFANSLTKRKREVK
jgi:hypothetical protein